MKNENIRAEISKFPSNNHWNTFPPSLNNALEFYFENIQKNQDSELTNEEYEVTIKVKVPKKEYEVFITGNQTNLGDWNPEKVKMKKVSDYERKITLKLKSPVQFKFTRGNWDTEAEVIGTYGNVMIKPRSKKIFDFEIENYFDRYEEE
ncbi:CBM20 domain-containing protein [Zunongwangia sp.]|uniref:CBM20 domain-containing protein n=1 Tax=Zunongwangia sp. TaxID=1965325 RepID=UPI003AA9DB5B